MKFSAEEYMVLEEIITQASIPLIELDKYLRLFESLKTARQNEDLQVEIDIEYNDLKLFHSFFLESDFKLRDFDFVVELIHKLGMFEIPDFHKALEFLKNKSEVLESPK